MRLDNNWSYSDVRIRKTLILKKNPAQLDGIFYFIDMFWDIIIQADTHIVVFIVCVNVLFLSNSQP